MGIPLPVRRHVDIEKDGICQNRIPIWGLLVLLTIAFVIYAKYIFVEIHR